MGESSVSSTELCSPQCCLGAFKNRLLTTLDAICKMHIWFFVCLSLEKLGSCELFYCLVCNCEFYKPTSRFFIVFYCSSLTAVLLFCYFLLAFLNQAVLKPGQQRWSFSGSMSRQAWLAVMLQSCSLQEHRPLLYHTSVKMQQESQGKTCQIEDLACKGRR